MTPSILLIVVLWTMRNSRPDATVGWSIRERADSQNVFPPEADSKSLSGLIAESQGSFDEASYQRQLQHEKLSPERVVPYRGSSHQAHRGVAPLECHRKSTAPQPRGGLNEDAATNASTSSLPDLPYIEETIEQGGISIGIIPPLTECVA